MTAKHPTTGKSMAVAVAQCVPSPTRRPFTKARCTKPAVNRFLCEKHRDQLKAENAARAKAATPKPKARRESATVTRIPVAPDAAKQPTRMAAFATPELAAKARAKRAPRGPSQA